jgi:hypothetical protein
MTFGNGRGSGDWKEDGSMTANANDNRPMEDRFTKSSSIEPTSRDYGLSRPLPRAANLRATDLFDDLWEDASGLRASVPLCATRRRVGVDK